jgi:hypothetical protein
MALNRKQPIDYTMRNQILSGRVNFAHFVQKQELVQQGLTVGLNVYPPTNDVSIVRLIQEGEVNTTPEELAIYLAQVRPQVAISTISPDPTDPTVPDAPTITSITSANQQLLIAFSAPASDGGDPIIDYEFTADGGTVWSSYGSTSSPISITGVLNGTLYTIQIRAVNSIGPGAASNSASGTPTGTQQIQSFTTVGTTSWTVPATTYSVEYLVVAGGGGSGGGYDTGAGGGGGAGEIISGTMSVVGGTVYTVIVGDGGTAGTVNRVVPVEVDGGTGGTSTFDTIIAAGGSGGFGSRLPSGGNNGAGGAQVVAGSGGGGGRGGGSNGGGGGGGGNGSAGGNKLGTTAGTGGSGISNSISGTPITYGAGGNGGTGGTTANGTAGTANRGNGARGGSGGSGNQGQGAQGGSGIVVLKYFF